ncbi:MAG: glycosyltransferase [Acidimicrobiales bacterium]
MTELQPHPLATRTVKVAVCIATRHRPEGLRRLLTSLAALEVGLDHVEVTVIVADNGDDHTAALVHGEFAPGAPFECIYLHEPRAGFVHARNAVLDTVDLDTDWVAFLDDDEDVHPLWLLELLAAADQHQADVVAGRIVAVCAEPVEDWRLELRNIDHGDAPTGTPVTHAAGGNLLIRRHLLHTTRFDEDFNRSGGEDGMITLQLGADGATMIWCREAVVHDHLVPSDFDTATVLKRELQGSQTFARARRLTAGRSPQQIVAPCARLLQGLVLTLLGWVTRSPARRVDGSVRMARAVGSIMGFTSLGLRPWPSSPTETDAAPDDGAFGGQGLRRAVGNTGWNSVGLAVSAVSGLIVFATLTRMLDAATFGIYAGSVAIAAIALGFASFGAPELLMRSVAHQESSAIDAWARGARVTLLTTVVVLALLAVPARLLIPQVSTWVVLLLAASDFINFALNKTNAALFYSERDFLRGNMASSAGDVTKAIAVLTLWAMGASSLEAIAIAFALASTTAVVIGTSLVLVHHGRPGRIQPAGRVYVGQGLSLAAGQASASINAGVDQTLLVRAEFERDAGLYGVAVRLMNYAMIPARAWLGTTYPEYFDRGTQGIGSVIAFGRRVGRPLIGWSVCVGTILFVGAPVAERLLGDEYRDSAAVIAAIAGIPLLLMLRSIMSDILVSTGRFGTRSAAIAVTAAVNVGLNLWLIPDHSWRGAVVATYVSEILLLTILGTAITRAARSEAFERDPVAETEVSAHASS